MKFPAKTMKQEGVYLGVDGCKGGWITAVYDNGAIHVEKYSAIETLVAKYSAFDEMLIDIPIGLPDTLSDLRPDAEARKIVSPRTSTIFAVPSRQAVYEYTEEKQIEANKKALGKSLSKQSMAIIPKIRELDQFLQKNPAYANGIKESHPEVCFARMKGRAIMSKKSDWEGILERVNILKAYLPNLNEKMVSEMAYTLNCKADDIVDAIVLAVTGNLYAQGECERIPEHVQEDGKGIKMQMIIPKG